MPKFKDLTGQIFGRLIVIKRAPNNGRRTMWLCQCNCKNKTKKIILSESLLAGKTKSCGCYLQEHGYALNRSHGLRNTHEYSVWCGMKRRCYSKNTANYKDYGGRGIYICDRWLNNFEAFYQDMGARPFLNYSIERIDNNGPYSPENCKWATRTEQNNNTRSIKRYTVNGESLTIKEWAAKLNLDRTTIYWRLKHGISLEEAVTKSFRSFRRN